MTLLTALPIGADSLGSYGSTAQPVTTARKQYRRHSYGRFVVQVGGGNRVAGANAAIGSAHKSAIADDRIRHLDQCAWASARAALARARRESRVGIALASPTNPQRVAWRSLLVIPGGFASRNCVWNRLEGRSASQSAGRTLLGGHRQWPGIGADDPQIPPGDLRDHRYVR